MFACFIPIMVFIIRVRIFFFLTGMITYCSFQCNAYNCQVMIHVCKLRLIPAVVQFGLSSQLLTATWKIKSIALKVATEVILFQSNILIFIVCTISGLKHMNICILTYKRIFYFAWLFPHTTFHQFDCIYFNLILIHDRSNVQKIKKNRSIKTEISF